MRGMTAEAFDGGREQNQKGRRKLHGAHLVRTFSVHKWMSRRYPKTTAKQAIDHGYDNCFCGLPIRLRSESSSNEMRREGRGRGEGMPISYVTAEICPVSQSRVINSLWVLDGISS